MESTETGAWAIEQIGPNAWKVKRDPETHAITTAYLPGTGPLTHVTVRATKEGFKALLPDGSGMDVVAEGPDFDTVRAVALSEIARHVGSYDAFTRDGYVFEGTDKAFVAAAKKAVEGLGEPAYSLEGIRSDPQVLALAQSLGLSKEKWAGLTMEVHKALAPALEAYVVNIHERAEGLDPSGGWISLPLPDDDVDRFLAEKAGAAQDTERGYMPDGTRADTVYEEYAIQDSSAGPVLRGMGFSPGDYDDLHRLNLLAKQVEALPASSLDALDAYCGYDPPRGAYSLMNLIEQADEIPFYPYDYDGAYEADAFGQTCVQQCSNEENLGYTILEGSEIKAFLEGRDAFMYFDVERYGRDAAINYFTLTGSGFLDNQGAGIDLGHYSDQELKERIEERYDAYSKAALGLYPGPDRGFEEALSSAEERAGREKAAVQAPSERGLQER